MMRAKMTVSSVARTGYSEELLMRAEYSNTKEDNSYSEATPNGEIKLTITNKALHGRFNPGDKFYVDFTPVPAAS